MCKNCVGIGEWVIQTRQLMTAKTNEGRCLSAEIFGRYTVYVRSVGRSSISSQCLSEQTNVRYGENLYLSLINQ